MITRVETEDIETTRSEKLVAAVLAAFMLVGAIWAYVKFDDIGGPAEFAAPVQPSGPERIAIDRHARAASALSQARVAEQQARQTLELRREAYRTALDAGQPAGVLRDQYLDAQAAFEAASARVAAAARREEATAPAAARATERLSRVQAAAAERLGAEQDDHELQTGLLRLLLILGALAVGYVALSRLRRDRSRYVLVAFAWIAATSILAVIFAIDYTDPFENFKDLGPLALSLAGIALTTVALVGLQRYLARRVPLRRVRRGECPFCGFPVRGNRHCEGCGRAVMAECATCHQPRRVGTTHCAACGAA